MFGTYRTLLALMVVFTHLGDVRGSGAYAVFGFYTLSGYLMTLIMHRSYGYSRTGLYQYGTNRFLRIIPLYWVAALFSVALLLWVGRDAGINYHHVLYIPADIPSVLRNVFIIFATGGEPRLVPPAWALTVELFFYLCIGLGLSKTKQRAWVWFAVSVVYHVAVSATKLGWNFRYSIIPGASLPFATGALIFLYKDELLRLIGRLNTNFTPYLLVALVFINLFVGSKLGTTHGASFYVNYLINAMVVISLSGRESLLGISRTVDNWLGDFSYPIYLIHYQVGLLVIIVYGMFGTEIHRPDMLLAFSSLPVILAFTWILIVTVERPMETIRDRLKREKWRFSGSATLQAKSGSGRA